MDNLVVIETQKVKSYLFASPIMRETRGASVSLDRLNRKLTREMLEATFGSERYEEIYFGGGSGRVLFKEKNDAEEFKQKVLNLYQEKTVNARVSVEVVERKATNTQENFSEWVARGVAQNQQNKLGRVEGIPMLRGRWIRPCSSCGIESAERVRFEHGEHYLCNACVKKRDEVKELYVDIKPGMKHRWKLKSSVRLIGRYTKPFIFTTLAEKAESEGIGLLLPQDFDDIGQKSLPPNYMGFIYADGDRMGEAVKRLARLFPEDEDAKRAYRSFSEIVDTATREAAVESVWKVVQRNEVTPDKGKLSFLPVEFIMAGGDDLMLAVPAHNALDVAIYFIETFREKTRQLQKEYIRANDLSKFFSEDGLTTSAGVVIAHAHYPASDLMTLAGDLMKLAKEKEAKTERIPKTGALDFMVLSEASSAPVKERRIREYRTSSPYGTEIALTERPYTTEEARKMLATIRDLKKSKIPRTKLKALYSVLFQNTMQAQFDALRIKERLKTTGSLGENNALGDLVSSLEHFPFRQEADGWTTPMTELIELYDFVLP